MQSDHLWILHNGGVERRRALSFALELSAAVVICYFMIPAWELLDAAFALNGTEKGLASPSVGSAIAYCAMTIVVLKVYRFGPWHSRFSLYTLLEFIVAGVLTGAVWLLSDEASGHNRAFLIALTVSVLVGLLSVRIAVRALSGLAKKYLSSRERIAVLGEGAMLANVISRLGQENSHLFRGIIVPEENSSLSLNVNVLGTVKQLAQVINRERLNRILVPEDYPEHAVEECIRVARRMGVTVSRPILVSASNLEISLVQIAGIHLLDMTPIFFTRRQEFIKRVFDVVVSGFSLVVLAPVMLVFALLIKVTSPGPVFFISPRVGRGGRHFSFLKFRSMYVGSEDRKTVAPLNEKTGHLFKLRRDPRITPLGWFMRRFSLDELPQLVNVLGGEMSLVGPRPLPAQDMNEDGQSSRFDIWSEQRSRVLPGITGLWQIRGRSNLSFEEMVELDVAYIRDWSLSLDWKILAVTPFVVVTGHGAY